MATFKLMMLTCGIFLALLFSFGVHVSHERPLKKAANFLPNNMATRMPNSVHGRHPLRHHDDHQVGPSDDDSDGAYGFVTGTNPGHSPGVGHSGGFQNIGSNV